MRSFELNDNSGRPGRSPLQPVGQDLEIKVLAGGRARGPLRISRFLFLHPIGFWKVGVLCDTFIIFCTCAVAWQSQWQYLVVGMSIFSERVVIFGARANQAWICWGASAPQLGLAKIFRRLLHSIFARVLTFFNRFLKMNLPGQAAVLASGFLCPRAQLQKCEKLMVKRRVLQGSVQNCERGMQFGIDF